MKRRQVLMGFAGLAVVAGLAAHSSEEAGVAAVILKRLSYLRLDLRGVRQFARDYAARGLISAGKLRAVSAVGVLYRDLPQRWADFLTRDIGHGEERIVTTFLLSSDFFDSNGKPAEAEVRPVHYVGFFDPLRGGNPFARLRVQTGWISGATGAAS